MPNKFLQSDQNMLSCLLLSQKPRQHILAAEERRCIERAMRELVEEKRRACELAKQLLQSNDDYLDRVIELWKIGNALYGQGWDTEFHIFGVIESDTDRLPTTKVCDLCSKEWLVKADTELAGSISFYQQKVSEACNEILAKHGNA